MINVIPIAQKIIIYLKIVQLRIKNLIIINIKIKVSQQVIKIVIIKISIKIISKFNSKMKHNYQLLIRK